MAATLILQQHKQKPAKEHELTIAIMSVCSYVTWQLAVHKTVLLHPKHTSLHTHENQLSKQWGKPQGMQAKLSLQMIGNVWFLKKQQANKKDRIIHDPYFIR
jgi:hypothetical protein